MSLVEPIHTEQDAVHRLRLLPVNCYFLVRDNSGYYHQFLREDHRRITYTNPDNTSHTTRDVEFLGGILYKMKDAFNDLNVI